MNPKDDRARFGNFFLLTLSLAFPFSQLALAENYCPTTSEIEQAKKSKDTDLLNDWLLHATSDAGKGLSPSCAAQLLNAGANPNLKKWDESLLSVAIDNEDAALAKALIAAGADVNATGWRSSVLSRLVEVGDLELVKQALVKGAKITGELGFDALKTAIYRGRLDIIKFLITKGADPRSKKQGESSTLYAAAASGNQEVFHYFLNMGFPINDKLIDKGRTSLVHAAAEGGSVEILKAANQFSALKALCSFRPILDAKPFDSRKLGFVICD